ncbi:MAG TPA: hypothetical protein VOB72_09080 [Candidatus Dormibacteraeota bacterium]|nr:hypothetical protein [Candidatus Dormibacteraeota bacterium]
MPGYGVGLSTELAEQLRRQPFDVQREFRAVCDRLADRAMARTIERDQLRLPGFTNDPDRIDTDWFGFNGAVGYRFVGNCQFEILHVHWPTEVDEGTPAGRRERDRC